MTTEAVCWRCRFWQHSFLDAANRQRQEIPPWQAGECRRHSPVQPMVVRLSHDNIAKPEWPPTNSRDWCGDFEALTDIGVAP